MTKQWVKLHDCILGHFLKYKKEVLSVLATRHESVEKNDYFTSLIKVSFDCKQKWPNSMQIFIPLNFTDFYTILTQQKRNYVLRPANVLFGWKDTQQTFGLWCSCSGESLLYRGINRKERVNRQPQQALAFCSSLANLYWQRKWHGSTISTQVQVT